MKPPKYTNNLIRETSPYLLQHAHNPVEWFAWSDEAFAKAQADDKPVLLSIGYSACHWCHVMERESFENEEVARLMNENFVNIKVDLEERPDIDQIYMTYVQITQGNGGYPLNVFLTPDRKPFFGGTYFPPEPRFRMPAFPHVLRSVADAWKTKRDELLEHSNEVLYEIRNLSETQASAQTSSLQHLDEAFQTFVKYFDTENGGFGNAPKFPPAQGMEFLLRFYHRTKNKTALEMVKKTADKMACGGIFDQLGGGFHRYSTDNFWLVPHFEKMLYDNGLLVRPFLHLFQITKDDFYKEIAVRILEYVKREMTDEKSGFYSAQDADSEGVEGKFFVWTAQEIEDILGTEDAQIFSFFYDVSDEGNFEGKNILNVKNSIAETAEALKISVEDLQKSLANSREKLFNEREKRPKPFRDEKVLTAWNGLMLAAFAESAAILQSAEYLEIAKRNADFILENLQKDGRLCRVWKDGTARLNAYLDDYTHLADGLLELFQVSGEIKYFVEAERLTNLIIDEFQDIQNGGFFYTAENHEKLIVRTKDFHDNAVPSGNSAAADVLLKLFKLTGNEKYQRLAAEVLQITLPMIQRYPQAFGRALCAAEFYLSSVKEIVILGEKGSELEKEIWREFLPNKIVVQAENPDSANILPILQNRRKINGKPTVYVCENFVCQKPVINADELRKQL